MISLLSIQTVYNMKTQKKVMLPNTRTYLFLLFFLTISFNSIALDDQEIKVSKVYQSATKQVTLKLSGKYIIKDRTKKEISCSEFGEIFEVKNLDKDIDEVKKCFGILKPNGELSKIYIDLHNDIDSKNTYWINFKGKKLLTQIKGKQYYITLKKYGGLLSKRELSFEFDKIIPNQITVINDNVLDDNANYTVTVKHKGKKDKNVPIVKDPILNDPRLNAPESKFLKRTTLVLDTRLKNDDIVVVKTTDSVGEISGTKKISASHPKSSKDAINYFSLSLEKDDNRDQKSIFSFNYKYDNSKNKARYAKGNWSKITPVVDIDYDNSDKNTKQKANVKLQWSKYDIKSYRTQVDNKKEDANGKYPFYQRFYNIGIGLEFEDDLKNKNIVTSFNITNNFLNFTKKKWPTNEKGCNLKNKNYSKIKNDDCKKEYNTGVHIFNPLVGIELGRNFGLGNNIINANEVLDYDIARLVLDLNYTYKHNMYTTNLFDSISFSVSNKMHYIFSDEVHVRSVMVEDEKKDKGFLEDGFREFWKVELLFGFSDRVGLSLKHENGQVPQFFKDEDKVSLSLVYSY